MSRFLFHKPCPRCGSKDNCGEYDDGHEYCFGCKYFKPGKTNLAEVHRTCPVITANSKNFPEDAEYYIPVEPMKWLLSCGITYSTQKQFGIQWSPSQQLVCWKIGNLGWQGRCFSPEAKTKYISHGKIHEEIYVIGSTFPLSFLSENPRYTVVLVEDYISAIRVSNYLPVMPLFGCTINLEALITLARQFNTVLVWLDSDKLDNARRIAKNANMVGLEGTVIYTKKDPKEYTNEEIKEKLNDI
jgi:hypothetical protein